MHGKAFGSLLNRYPCNKNQQQSDDFQPIKWLDAAFSPKLKPVLSAFYKTFRAFALLIQSKYCVEYLLILPLQTFLHIAFHVPSRFQIRKQTPRPQLVFQDIYHPGGVDTGFL
jgi:hypothetical protein